MKTGNSTDYSTTVQCPQYSSGHCWVGIWPDPWLASMNGHSEGSVALKDFKQKREILVLEIVFGLYYTRGAIMDAFINLQNIFEAFLIIWQHNSSLSTSATFSIAVETFANKMFCASCYAEGWLANLENVGIVSGYQSCYTVRFFQSSFANGTIPELVTCMATDLQPEMVSALHCNMNRNVFVSCTTLDVWCITMQTNL